MYFLKFLSKLLSKNMKLLSKCNVNSNNFCIVSNCMIYSYKKVRIYFILIQNFEKLWDRLGYKESVSS